MTAAPVKPPESDLARKPGFTILRYFADLALAADNLRAQKTRSFLTALGIVFGDIGTSPLYAMRESALAAGGNLPGPAATAR